MKILGDLQPGEVFHYFEEICGIPHGSGDTKRISDYCMAFADAHHLKARQDALNNVVIWKPGTAGYEAAEPVVLQGHLDMVCEKEADVTFDFEKEGLRLQVSEGFVSAEGTTLGGDDGIAVAYALALLAAEDIPHPPLEVIFTVDEEIGMFGAAALDCSDIKGRRVLNIDSEEEGYLLVSCAGGADVWLHMPIERESKRGLEITISVGGLVGGHSGVEIDKDSANADILLGRLLYAVSAELTCHLVSVQGGQKSNAIPRNASATLLIQPEDAERLQELVLRYEALFRTEYSHTDKELLLTVGVGVEQETECMTADSMTRSIALLVNAPNGVQRMSKDIAGLVQTSLNLGILTLKEDALVAVFCVRSSMDSEKDALLAKLKSLASLLRGSMEVKGDYPGWQYRADSPLRTLMTEVYRRQYHKEPVIQAIHAGLECGLLAGKLDNMDCVSFGPDIKDIHTPSERLDIVSVERTWKYLLEVLKELK